MTNNQDTKKGFNQGYDLQHLHPTLAEKVSNGFMALETRNEYQNAFLKGAKQYQKEQIKVHTRHYKINKSQASKENRTRSKDKDDLIKE